MDDTAWFEPLKFDAANVDRPELSRIYHLLNTRHWRVEDPPRDRTTTEILILEATNVRDQYARIGAGLFKDESFFEGLPLERLLII